jgi:lipid A ethanolaminephosphotransferase
MKLKFPTTRWMLIVLASLFISSVGNWAFWNDFFSFLPSYSLRNLGFTVGTFFIISGLVSTLLSLIIWPKIAKFILSVLFIVSALGCYFMVTYGIVIDSDMLVNVLQTDVKESHDLLSWKLFATLFALGILPSIFVWKINLKTQKPLVHIKENAIIFVTGLLVAVISIFAVYQDFASLMRNHPHIRFLITPLNTIYGFGQLTIKPLIHGPKEFKKIGEDAKIFDLTQPNRQTPLLILVVGETARSGNLSINGYSKPTTPKLEILKQNGEISSFTNVWSCGTSTATSLPCMFSPLGKKEFESRSYDTENLVDVLSKSGMGVIWIDNQSGCKGICDRIPNYQTSELQLTEFCTSNQCFDEVMLYGLDRKIKRLPIEQQKNGVVIILHQIGSHGPAYSKRSPKEFKKFQPECTSNVLQECKANELINAYDNSIFYLDHFLTTTIQWQKKRSQLYAMSMVYLSDHGESLGEKNIYLHGLPYAIAPSVQKKIPWITWMAPEFQKQRGIDMKCLNTITEQKFSHDNLFHSVLGLMNVQTKEYQKSLDIYSVCAK